ncbi:uncharacterized protein LOC131432653 [Malaya genurostris]|uniref:uncharacterized protein LOC131432653 n=1 Tax=Malaya genurostris TaxID=325434 RepID=UPI0026F3BD3F|nr:uncharacterized protein LOC131432653 [Malaya genurostris]
MSCPRDILKKLMYKPKPSKKSDVLTDREYKRLAATSFEDYLAQNYNCSQLNRLCSSERDHLQIYYEYLEKRVERNQKRIRNKRTKKPPAVIVRNVPATSGIPPVCVDVPIVTVSEGIDGRLLPTLEDFENVLREPNEQTERHMQDSIPNEKDLDTSSPEIELYQVMAPKELLIEETVTTTTLANPELEGIVVDLESVPLSDPQVRAEILNEFPSLRPRESNGRFEDFEENPLAAETGLLVPPTTDVGLKASTPISSIPISNIRRIVPGADRLETADLSAINDPTPLKPRSLLQVDAPTEFHAVDVSNTQQLEALLEKEPQAILSTQQIPFIEHGRNVELTEVDEQILQEEPVRPQTVPGNPTTSSESSVDRPPPERRVPKLVKKVRLYNDSIGESNDLRKQFEIFDDLEDFGWFDAGRNTIKALVAMRRNPDAQQMHPTNEMRVPRESLVADIEQQPILRDKSTTFADISSIREQTAGKLYMIMEGREENDVQLQLQSRTAPAAIEELSTIPEIPIAQTILPDSQLYPRISLIETGNDIQPLDPNITNFETPQMDSIRISDNRNRQPEAMIGDKNSQQVNMDSAASVPAVVIPDDGSKRPDTYPMKAPFTLHDMDLVSVSN